MRKIVEYTIFTNLCIEELEDRVNAMIKQGLQPYGNLYSYPYEDGDIRHVQPVVKYEEISPEKLTWPNPLPEPFLPQLTPTVTEAYNRATGKICPTCGK